MAITEKKVLLGVKKTKVPSKRTKKKHFLRKFLDYLKSDSYLFAPLISPSIKNVEAKVEKTESERKLVKKVRDYLMSDSYMYASLVVAPPKSFYVPPKVSEAQPQIKRVTTVEVTRRSITLKDESQLANGIAKAGHAAKDYFPQKVTKDRRPQPRKETIQRPFYQTYPTTRFQKECLAGSKIKKLC